MVKPIDTLNGTVSNQHKTKYSVSLTFGNSIPDRINSFSLVISSLFVTNHISFAYREPIEGRIFSLSVTQGGDGVRVRMFVRLYRPNLATL